jgi:hypothetical protein
MQHRQFVKALRAHARAQRRDAQLQDPPQGGITLFAAALLAVLLSASLQQALPDARSAAAVAAERTAAAECLAQVGALRSQLEEAASASVAAAAAEVAAAAAAAAAAEAAATQAVEAAAQAAQAAATQAAEAAAQAAQAAATQAAAQAAEACARDAAREREALEAQLAAALASGALCAAPPDEKEVEEDGRGREGERERERLLGELHAEQSRAFAEAAARCDVAAIARACAETGAEAGDNDAGECMVRARGGADGATPLHSLVRCGAPNATLTLLAGRGAALDAGDASGRTALMIAVEAGRADTVELLLALGASVHAVDDAGRNALALRALAPRVSDAFLACGTYDETEQYRAKCPGRWRPKDAVVRRLVAAGASARARDRDGLSPLDHWRIANANAVSASASASASASVSASAAAEREGA